MNRTIPTETRLLGLTPEQYTQWMEQARRDAVRLRREAIADFELSIITAVGAAWAALRCRLARLRRARLQEA